MTKLENKILCGYLVDIYKNYINPNLTDDELIYSATLEMKFLDLWKNFIFVLGKDGFKIDQIRSYSNVDLILEAYDRYGGRIMIDFNIFNDLITVGHVYTDLDNLLLPRYYLDTTDLVIYFIKKHKLDIELYKKYVNNAL